MAASTERHTGICKFFDCQKGFGFILPDATWPEAGQDIFVHQSVINAEGFRSLAEGEKVEYDIEIDASGRMKAANVTGPSGAFVQGAPRRPQNQQFMGMNGGGRGGRGGRGRGGFFQGQGRSYDNQQGGGRSYYPRQDQTNGQGYDYQQMVYPQYQQYAQYGQQYGQAGYPQGYSQGYAQYQQ